MKINAPLYALLLLCVLALHMLTHAQILPAHDLSKLQAEVCYQLESADSLTALEGGELGPDDCKPPKNSFIDYSTFLAPDHGLPPYQPEVSLLRWHERLQAPPEVHLDLIAPPHPA